MKRKIYSGPLAWALLTAALGALGSSPALAQEDIRFQGTTQGCFGEGCTPTGGDSSSGLGYTSGSFDGYAVYNSSTGQYQLGINGGVGSLGWFSLDATQDNYQTPFQLVVSFTAPTVMPPDAVYDALLSGVIKSTGGGVVVEFENNVQTLAFATDDGRTGNFSLTVANQLSLSAGGTNELTGMIAATTTPEPVSMALLGTGLMGVAGVARRRRNGKMLDA